MSELAATARIRSNTWAGCIDFRRGEGGLHVSPGCGEGHAVGTTECRRGGGLVTSTHSRPAGLGSHRM
jgi:hypothetical protein